MLENALCPPRSLTLQIAAVLPSSWSATDIVVRYSHLYFYAEVSVEIKFLSLQLKLLSSHTAILIARKQQFQADNSKKCTQRCLNISTSARIQFHHSVSRKCHRIKHMGYN